MSDNVVPIRATAETPSLAADLDNVLDQAIAAFDFSIDVLKAHPGFRRRKRNELLEEIRTSYHRLADLTRLARSGK